MNPARPLARPLAGFRKYLWRNPLNSGSIPLSSFLLTFFLRRESEVPVCLLGNKQDLCHARQVCEDEGRRVAQESRCHFQEVSAAEGYQDIANLFTLLIRQVMEQLRHRTDRRRYSGSKSMAKLINNVFGKRRKSV